MRKLLWERVSAALLLSVLCLPVQGARPAPSFHGSFELGASEPDGWSPSSKSSVWLQGNAHSGMRAVKGSARQPQQAWVSEPIPLASDEPYRMDGWIKPLSGTGWLEVVLLDRQGKRVFRGRSPKITGNRDWTYVAVETPPLPTNNRAPFTAQIAFWVSEGAAAADDVAIRPASPRVMANGDFESPLDNKGRAPYWSEESEETLFPGHREGSLALDDQDQDAFDGKACATLTSSGDWFGACSVPYSVPAWTDRVELRAMARSGPGAHVQVAAVWTDYAQRIIRTDHSLKATSMEWCFVTTGPLTPPKGAFLLRPLLVVHKAPGIGEDVVGWFDQVDLRTLGPSERRIRVLVNQIGYETLGPKTAVVLTNFFPKSAVVGRFELVSQDGSKAHKSPLVCLGRMYGQGAADWGWYFWRADFSQVCREGKYTLRAIFGKEAASSCPFSVGHDLLFRETANVNVNFFFVQRCGIEVPGWHAACHLDDAKLPDGTHRDLTGGWHSAGDYNKIIWEYGDGGVMYALVNAFEAAPEVFAGCDRDRDGLPDVIDEVWWGAKFLAKVQISETGGLLNHIEQGPDRKTWMNWCPPEKTTDNVVGTPDDPIVQPGEGHSPLGIAAWARLAKLLDARGIPNDYLVRAIRLWEHATAGAASAGDPLLLISSVELYLITKDARFLEFSRRNAEGLLSSETPDGRLRGGYGDSGDIPAAALAHFALKLPDDPLSPRIKERLQKHLPGFVAEADNPMGLMRQKLGADGHYFDPTSTLGCNYQILCRAWSALMVYRVTSDRRAWDYAASQLDFILGKNPYNLCMLEGKGSLNPPRYHHRYITIPGHERGAVPGAIPNGFVRDVGGFDRPGMDMSTEGRLYPSYRTSEPWLVHNVFYMLAITALHAAQ